MFRLVAILVILAAVACVQPANPMVTPTSEVDTRATPARDAPTATGVGVAGPRRPGVADTFLVNPEGRPFAPVLGPLRSELLQVERLQDTGLVEVDGKLQEGSVGDPVYKLPGLSLDEGFLVRYTGPHTRFYTSAGTYPTCSPGYGAFVFTAQDAEPPPPPLGPKVMPGPSIGQATATPWATPIGEPVYTPTPPPTVSWIPARLSAPGLLSVGWPTVYWEALSPECREKTYRYTSHRYINYQGNDTSIRPDALEEVELLKITYDVDAEIPAPADGVFGDATVTDKVRILRLKDRPASEVIIVDTCPSDFHGEMQHYILYTYSPLFE